MTAKCTIISDQRGSSLIVVGLFVMALGMLSAAGLQIYDQYGQARKLNETQVKLETVKTAMLAYFSQNGRFPCPAPLSAPMDDAFYGREAISPCGDGGPGKGVGEPVPEEVAGGGEEAGGGGGLNIEIGAGGIGVGIGELEIGLGESGIGEIIEVGLGEGGLEIELGGGPPEGTPPVTGETPAGTTPPGLELETAPTIPTEELPKHWGGRDVGWELPADENYNPGKTSYSNGTIVVRGRQNKNVRIGNVPTRALNLPDDMGYDEWGHRLVYVITEEMALADAATIHNIGAITLQDLGGNSVSSSPGNVVLLIMSSGGDPRGAINAQGNMVESCDTGAVAGRNCDANATFVNSVNKIHDMGTDTFSHRMVYVGADFNVEIEDD